MHADSLFTYATLFGFLFTLARVATVFAFLPLAAFRGAPEPARIVLALACTLILWPEWSVSVSADATIGRIVAGLAGEAALGLAIGLTLAIILEVFQVAAQIVSLQAGFGYASTIDPSSGADSTVLLSLAQLVAGLLFFATGSERLLIHVLADSIRLCPPETFVLKMASADAIVKFAGTIFGLGLRLAAPVVALLLLVDLILAVLGRVQQSLQLVSLAMPMKLSITMLLLASTIALQPSFFESMMTSGVRFMETFLRSAH